MNTKNILNSYWLFPLIIGIIIIISFRPFVGYITKSSVEHYSILFNSQKKDSTTKSLQIFSPQETGPIGDTFSGTAGPTIALFGAFLTFIAFWIQYKSNKQQEDYIKQQRFEDSFFRFLDHFHKILSSIDFRALNDPTQVKAIGSESFKRMYKDFEDLVGTDLSIENINKQYDAIHKKYRHDLHHYFRFLYHIIKFVKKSKIDEEEKYKYSSILRASLSAYELTFLFYNCLRPQGNKYFKPLLEEFSFLKNIDESLILNSDQMDYYDDLTFAKTGERQKLLKIWKETQAVT